MIGKLPTTELHLHPRDMVLLMWVPALHILPLRQMYNGFINHIDLYACLQEHMNITRHSRRFKSLRA